MCEHWSAPIRSYRWARLRCRCARCAIRLMNCQKSCQGAQNPVEGVLRTYSKCRRNHAARRCPKPTGGVLGIYVKTPGFSAASTQLGRHVAQSFVRQYERAPDQLRVVIDKVRKPHPGQQRHRKHFLDRLFELEKAHDLTSL